MIADTNVLVRAWAGDDDAQSAAARELLRTAERVYVSNAVLCEFVWVVRRTYRQTRAEIAQAIRLLTADDRLVTDSAAVEAGLAFLDAGGDFADGVIEFEGRRLGGSRFVTFDRRAAKIMRDNGRDVLLLPAEAE